MIPVSGYAVFTTEEDGEVTTHVFRTLTAAQALAESYRAADAIVVPLVDVRSTYVPTPPAPRS
jgi:hypothetical protein